MVGVCGGGIFAVMNRMYGHKDLKRRDAMVGLVDCNNFFVSCERVVNPELVGRPVIVLSNNDGCAVAMSEEAKALGIKRGEPFFKIRSLCERHGVVSLSGNHRLYGEISARVMATLRSLTPNIDVYSIDEAFMEISPAVGAMDEYGRYVVEEVMARTGIPVSLGIATTKTLAKIAARFAKKYRGYRGACLMDTEEKVLKALQLTKVEDVWGIGRRHSRKLKERGVVTAYDFLRLDEDMVQRLFHIGGVRTWRELHGDACIEHEPVPPERQTISVSRTFARDVHDFESLRQSVCAYVSSAARKLRHKQEYAGEVSVFVCTNRYHQHDPQYHNVASVRMEEPTDFTPALADAAVKALGEVYRDGFGYKRAGVTLSRICSRAGLQTSLFGDAETMDRHSRLMRVVDAINNASPEARDRVIIASTKPVSKKEG